MISELPVMLQKVTCVEIDKKTEVSFAHYYQPDARVQFAYNVEWIALCEKNRAVLLISKNGLYCKPFDENGNRNWETSSLRKWLNSDWVGKCFSHWLECLLIPVSSKSPLNVRSLLPYEKPVDGFRSKSADEDYVFLLSESEVTELLDSQTARMVPHWMADRSVIDSIHNAKWWIRSTGVSGGNNIIDEEGKSSFISPDADGVFVRPAVWVDNFYIQRCFMDAVKLWEKQIDSVKKNAFNYEMFKEAASAAYSVLYLYSNWADKVVSYPKLVTELIILIAKYSEMHITDETSEHILSLNAADALCEQSIHWNTIYKHHPSPGQPGALKNGFIMQGLHGESIVVDASTFDMLNPMDKQQLSNDGYFTL